MPRFEPVALDARDRDTAGDIIRNHYREEFTMQYVWFALIGIVAGFIAGKIMEGRGFGILGNLVVGVVGAVLGGFLFGLLGLTSTSLLGSLVVATVGAIVLLAIVGAVFKGK
jgi:uncharacterized membrane protein YeaQ/YmgE (transglycosylase-associated protein family)